MIESLCDWLAASAPSQLLASLSWFVPTVQTVHILAIAVALTAVAMLDLRVLGLTRRGLALADMAALARPAFWAALGVLLVSGALLTLTEPARELLSDVFRLKMVLVLGLAANTAYLQRQLQTVPGARPRTAAVLNLALVVGVIAAGRFIAYV